ncbi:hypothetical protein [Streptomyces somaliensis]|nr:hypothetical protein [Streptomyces somaliensis]
MVHGRLLRPAARRARGPAGERARRIGDCLIVCVNSDVGGAAQGRAAR